MVIQYTKLMQTYVSKYSVQLQKNTCIINKILNDNKLNTIYYYFIFIVVWGSNNKRLSAICNDYMCQLVAFIYLLKRF